MNISKTIQRNNSMVDNDSWSLIAKRYQKNRKGSSVHLRLYIPTQLSINYIFYKWNTVAINIIAVKIGISILNTEYNTYRIFFILPEFLDGFQNMSTLPWLALAIRSTLRKIFQRQISPDNICGLTNLVRNWMPRAMCCCYISWGLQWQRRVSRLLSTVCCI